MKTYTRLSFLLVISWLLVGCETEPSPTAVPEPTPIPEETAAPIPTAEATAAPTPTPEPDPLVQGTDGYPWWNDTVFYEVFVRSFYDSDGDGIGDINGLIEKLDYLNDGDPTTSDDLGVTGIWLMPIMESPSYHGYDVVDYYTVNEDYGTNEDFQRLIAEAHARGIRVIVDLVMNHTSRQHPWFQESKDPESERRDWYIWSDEKPDYRGPWGQEVWHPLSGSYYYGVFWEGMPDLNYNNIDVTTAMFEVALFWLDEMGADGFRVDAVKHIFEDGALQENRPATHEWLKEFHIFYKGVNPDAFVVGEAWTATSQVVEYTGDEVDIAFEFDLAAATLNSAGSGLGDPFASALENSVNSFPPGQYATFITNHDQNRVMSQLGGDEGKAKIAATLLLTAPGVPFIYYGEEIGMTGTKPDEDIRRPMQWSGESFRAGFTEGDPWRAPANDYEERNVTLQDDDPGSLLNHYRALINLRNNHEALRIGNWVQAPTGSARVYACLRYSDDETILVLLNLDDEPVTEYSLELTEGPLPGTVAPVLLLGDGDPIAPTINADGGFTDYVPFESLPAQSSFIIQLVP